MICPPVQKPHPPLYFGGSSKVAIELAARQVDVYLTWGEPPALVVEKVSQVRRRAEESGRQIRFGIPNARHRAGDRAGSLECGQRTDSLRGR